MSLHTGVDAGGHNQRLKVTSSAGAERSDGPHKGGLRGDVLNDSIFMNNLI